MPHPTGRKAVVTLTAEPGVDLGRPSIDRRGRAAEPRRSWASAHPVEERETAINRTAVVARQWARVGTSYRRRTVALDVLVAVVVGTLVMAPIFGGGLETVGLVAVGVVGFVLLVAVNRGYDLRELGNGPVEFQALWRAGALGMVVMITASYATMAEVSRFLVFGGVPALVATAALARYAHRKVLHRARQGGRAMKRTLVVGHPYAVGHVAEDLGRATYHGFEVVGTCLPSLDDESPSPALPVVGAIADVPQVVVDHAVDIVIVTGGSLQGDALRRLSWALDRVGAQLIVAPDLVEVHAPRLTLRPTGELSLLELEVGTPRSRVLAKAVLDRVLGVGLLVALAPVLLGAALLVRLTSAGPAFYRQTRIGVDGEEFTLFKLRSMYVDADERRRALLERSEGNEVLFKMKDDPRVTPVGRVLRRFSIDELPQLLNVVRGDMSLVGPRPPLGEEVAAYADAVYRRLRVKPGLTGLWQVSGRSDLSWEESVRLDLRYVDNWSLAMDLLILWKTFRAVLGASGAY